MAQMTVTLNLSDAPAFIAGLVKQGLTFQAVQKEDMLLITLTGGF